MCVCVCVLLLCQTRRWGVSLVCLFLAAGSAAEQCGRRGCQLGLLLVVVVVVVMRDPLPGMGHAAKLHFNTLTSLYPPPEVRCSGKRPVSGTGC